MAILDWAIPVASLLNKIQKGGYKIQSIDTGEETIKIDQNVSNLVARKAAVEEIVSVDVSWVRVHKNDKNFTLFIVLGNEPSELVADYIGDRELDNVLNKFAEYWECKKCPTIKE